MIPHNTHLHIGSLVFEGVDQIDLTGPVACRAFQIRPIASTARPQHRFAI